MHRCRPERPAALLALLLLLLAGAARAEELVILDRIAAIVDDDVIMESDVANRVKDVNAQLAARGGARPPADILRRQVLDRLVLESIQVQLGNRTGVRIDDEALNQAIAGIAKQNGTDLRSFIDRLQSEGLDYTAFREQVRRDMVINRVRQRRVGERVRITDADVEDFLKSAMAQDMFAASYRLGHILVSVPETATPEQAAAAQAKADAVATEARAGADFGDLAVRSSDAANALEGGDLGWRSAGQLPTLFAGQVTGMKKGDVAGPLRSASGLHIVKLLDVKGAEPHVVQQANVRHILVKPSQIRSPEETRALIHDLRARLADGADFHALARQYSEDPGSAVGGGELGWVSPGQMVEEFERVMAATPAGALSEPFETQFGWHLLQVTARRDQDTSDEWRRQQARNALWKRKYDVELDNWLREIRNEAYVDTKNPG